MSGGSRLGLFDPWLRLFWRLELSTAPQANDVRDMLRRILLTERYKIYLKKYSFFKFISNYILFNVVLVVVW